MGTTLYNDDVGVLLLGTLGYKESAERPLTLYQTRPFYGKGSWVKMLGNLRGSLVMAISGDEAYGFLNPGSIKLHLLLFPWGLASFVKFHTIVLRYYLTALLNYKFNFPL